MKKIKVTQIMPGCKIAETAAGDIMFGCPPEIIKVLLRIGRQIPSKIVLPASFFRFGINQAALEFPLYHFLFFQGGAARDERLTVFGTAEQIERMRVILQLTLLGPTVEMMKKWRIAKSEIDEHLKMQAHLGLRKKSGELKELDDLVDFREFNALNFKMAGERIFLQIAEENVFKMEQDGEESFIDINFAEKQKPPLPIDVPERLPHRSILGAISLSKCTTGFDPSGYTSGLVFSLNGLLLAVDGVSWMKEHLLAHGISTSEICAHLITHIHDDHSNIFDLIVNGKKTTLLTSRIIYKSFLLKAANILNLTSRKVKQMVNFIKAVPGEKLNWYGAEFDFWRTVHTVPTIGFRVTVDGKSIVLSGDTLWGSNLKKAKELGVISQSVFEAVNKIPFLASEITFMDVGGGVIHPKIEELAELPEQIIRRLIPTHAAVLPKELESVFSLIRPTQSWEIIPQKVMDAGDMLAAINAPLIQSLSQSWKQVVISQGYIVDYPANRIILQEGGEGKSFYLILGGAVKVICQGEEVAKLAAGDFFGEISLLEDIPCTASIETISPSRILELPRDVFRVLTESTSLRKRLKQIHEVRPVLINVSLFHDLSAENINRLIDAAAMRNYAPGETIIRQLDPGDTFYGIIEGRVEITVNTNGAARHVATLYKNQCFGEMALIENGKRTANVIAETAVKVFSLRREKFLNIMRQVPNLSYEVGIMAAHRRKELERI